MRILFGPEHDGLHIDPSEPNGYEWWYFDAISDDEKYIFVVIFFLGTPMSPYYKSVVDGKNPLPKDWCGVFFSLHERTNSGYQEKAYTYNLYTWDSDFESNSLPKNYIRDKPLDIRLGKSTVSGRYSHNGRRFTHDWQIDLDEKNLWLGSTHAQLRFDTETLLKHEPLEGDADHTWACVAPQCWVTGTFTLASGQTVSFSGNGYHDHNFGRLPWSDIQSWSWSRTHFGRDAQTRGIVNYAWLADSGRKNYFFFWAARGEVQIVDNAASNLDVNLDRMRSKRWMVHEQVTGIDQAGLQIVRMSQPMGWSNLQHSPFYHRFPIVTETQFSNGDSSSHIGVGEEFRPDGLCGPIISRMMWTRIRRRS